MKTVTKLITGAAAAAMLTVTAAAPAEAQYRSSRRDHVDSGDVIAGVAILGGIAAIAAAIGNDGNRYGYGQRYRYRDGYSAAVNACGYQAQRAGGGRINVTDVDRRGNDSFRVRGTVEGAGYGRGFDRYDRGNANRGFDRVAFTCTARGNGQVRDFRIAQAW
jgi:hypothetical protein